MVWLACSPSASPAGKGRQGGLPEADSPHSEGQHGSSTAARHRALRPGSDHVLMLGYILPSVGMRAKARRSDGSTEVAVMKSCIPPSNAPVLPCGHAKLFCMQVFRRGVGGVPRCSLIPPAQPSVRSGVRTAMAVSASHSFCGAFRRILFRRYSFFRRIRDRTE